MRELRKLGVLEPQARCFSQNRGRALLVRKGNPLRTFPTLFELVPIAGAERFPVRIAFGRVINPLRPQAALAFEEFFFGRAQDVYPRYDFARVRDDDYGATLKLD